MPFPETNFSGASRVHPARRRVRCLPPPQEAAEHGGCVGLDVASGEPADPHLNGVLDNYIVKRQILQRWAPQRCSASAAAVACAATDRAGGEGWRVLGMHGPPQVQWQSQGSSWSI